MDNMDNNNNNNNSTALLWTAIITEQQAEPATAVLFPWVTQAVGVCCLFLVTRFELPLPYAAVMFCVGIFMGVGAVSAARRAAYDLNQVDALSTSILQWSNINSAVLLLVFLPGLIFRDAIEVNFSMFMASLSQILILAFPMVLVGTVLTAVVAVYVIPYNWHWSLAATLGAILASTDPVAVGSVLKKAGAPPRLQLLISGESLLNDGSAVVFYTIFARQYLAYLGYAEPVDVGEGFAIFFRMSFGGIAVGVAFAIGLLALLYELDRRLEPEYNVLQVVAALTCAYLSYYVSEQVCRMSGVIACVVCGIVARALGRGLINNNQLMDSYLALMEYLLNTLLFTLGGVVWGKVVADGVTRSIGWDDCWYLLALYALVVVIRFFQVGFFYPIFSRIGLGSNKKEATFLAYGGLRGAVGIALALALNRSVREETDDIENLKATEELEFLAGGVTLLSLLINATTAGSVLKCLDLAKPVISRKRALRIFNSSAEAFVFKEYQSLLLEQRFRGTSFRVIKQHVPFATVEPTVSVAESELSERVAAAAIGDDEEHVSEIAGLLEVTERACPDEALIEMRQIFMELLSEAYRQELANGELDEREDAGINANLLQQSVEFGRADVDHNKQIQDWEWLDSQNNFRFFEDAKSFFIRKYRQKRRGQGADQCCTYDYQQTRIMVLRALAFIEAHRLASKKLLAYVDSVSAASMQEENTELFLGNAVETVLKESAVQVAEAKKVIEVTPPNEVESIVSHYAATILLHRLESFVETNATDGVLTKKEANVFFDKIDRNLQSTHTCNKEYVLDVVVESVDPESLEAQCVTTDDNGPVSTSSEMSTGTTTV